jgi:hypothetical protein
MMSFDEARHNRVRSRETYLDAASTAHLTAPRGLALIDHGEEQNWLAYIKYWFLGLNVVFLKP